MDEDDVPPPPYFVHDPHQPGFPRSSDPPQITTIFNAHIDAPSAANLGLSTRLLPIQNPTLATSSGTGPHGSPVATASAIPLPRSPNGVSWEELYSAGFVSAAPYFELRTPGHAGPRNTLFHHMTISPDSRPDNLLFPQPSENWTSRDVDQQDWMTFLNHLFPLHGYEQDSKVPLELDADAGLDEAGLSLSNARSRDQSRPLLGDNRPGPSTGGVDRELEKMQRLRKLRIEAVTSQWNEGFFGLRDLEVIVNINNFTAPVLVETAPRQTTRNVLKKVPRSEAEESLLHQLVARGKKSQVKLLLDKGGEDIEALNKSQETCLYRAVSRGDKEIVRLLMEYGADPTARPPGSDSVLHIACYNDKKTILGYILDKSRVGIEEPNAKGETPLYVALKQQRKSCIEVLLDAGANPNARPVGKDSMLNVAVSNDSTTIANLLLQRGVYVEELKDGQTPLYRAVSRGQTSMVKLLLDYGASATAKTSKGQAPLSLAVSHGSKNIFSLLLAEKDIDVEVENEKHQTPLWTAIYRDQTSMAEELLSRGADSNKSPPGEERMLNLAVSRSNTALTSLLLERGADFEGKNRSGESPLFQAVCRQDTAIVSLLLSKGANPDTRNTAGESALQRAVHVSSTSIVSLLVSKGANPDLKIVTGDSPLYTAVYRNSTALVSILLSHGANPESRSSGGELPMNRAIYTSSTSIVSILLSRGASAAAKNLKGESMMDYALKKGDKTIIQLLSANCPPLQH